MTSVVDRESAAGSDVLAGLRIVDADAHFTEPADLWSSRVPASWQDRVPVMRTIDGKTAWYLHDKVWASTGGNTIGHDGVKKLGTHIMQPFENVDISAWSVAERLALIDSVGVWAQILYPNGVGFASNHIFAIEDEEERTTILKVYNDFMVDVQLESNNRLFPQALLPIWDIDLTVKEMTRLLDKGITGFTLSDKPELLGLPELPEPFFAPMWDLFNESGAVANFHVAAGARREEAEAARSFVAQTGMPSQVPVHPSQAPLVASPAWRTFGQQRRLAVTASQMYMSNVRIIVNLCYSDLFDRYPKLNIVSAESGIGWIPFILEAMEFQLDEMVTTPAEVGLAKRRPADYFRDHIYVMFWFEKIAAAKLLTDIGVNNIMVETDIPHPTCLYPTTREHFARTLANVDEPTRRRVLQDNAVELYGIPLPK